MTKDFIVVCGKYPYEFWGPFNKDEAIIFQNGRHDFTAIIQLKSPPVDAYIQQYEENTDE